ncbi:MULTISPECIES: hypothetical protein [unclassified Campylobacter]|uniref:hypothetical protein n=1 Tax=unclassified Campylobacter TaxID=2593542 RepID=UPI001237B24F|nr:MULTISPECIES: hypothetical protein [unclassified Campylobacter]KAA6225015.1 hypothetical protein FMM54_06615 [Campylobacter sp. LR185c]KAA6225959.1 hypothetical protein FMM57_06790 [Campylobacter sp. LR286c]KAA6225974.1 hypothetical protein FMM55_05460 [Campylobacter sp. LR196d]KAA6230345.1 hypothetical protein FMM56_06200 [Campylobacter sp. LR264d]KAA6230969.1 hypothetical protein FMM58_03855 [Campylobacter sp. LR291e]
MQVGYKTVTSYEYDVLSGQYQYVETQVPNASASSEFLDMLSIAEMGQDESNGTALGSLTQDFSESSQSSQQGFFNTASTYAQNSSTYAYRFSQNASVESVSKIDQENSGILGDLLKAI